MVATIAPDGEAQPEPDGDVGQDAEQRQARRPEPLAGQVLAPTIGPTISVPSTT